MKPATTPTNVPCLVLVVIFVLGYSVCFAVVSHQNSEYHELRSAQNETVIHEIRSNVTKKKNKTTQAQDWKRQWNKEWTNWIPVKNPYPPQADIPANISERKFLSILHLSYKGEQSKCEDKNRIDCPVWSNLGYCDHKRLRYSTWMAENCPESCQQCKQPEPTREKFECKNLRQSCDRLSRFCSGPFKSHMMEWCPKSCHICNGSFEVQEGSGSSGDSELDPDQPNESSSTKTGKYEVHDDDQVCFPTQCGEAPAMKNRWLQLGRRRRSLIWERRKRRSMAGDVFGPRKGTNPSLGIPASLVLKIVGGSWARKGEWPWHGLILQKVGKYIRFCGVTIVCKRWLVTAAHCLASSEFGFPESRDMMNTFTIYVGRHQGMFGYMESTTQVFSKYNLKRFIIHPEFKITPSFKYDIALIELGTSIQFNTYVQPVCIPTVNTNSKDDVMWTYGWGATLGYGPSAQYLKKVPLPYVEREECKKFVWGLPETGIICAGGEARKDTCTGDSGGSLVKKMPDGRHYIFGVTSYGNKHCNSRYPYSPGIYTDVAHFYDWISEETRACCDSKSGIIYMKGSGIDNGKK